MPATDLFANRSSSVDGPPEHAAEVTPSDGTDLTYATRGLFIGVAGNLKVTMVGGQTVTFPNVPVGQFVARVTRVWSTGTTADDIVALW